MKMYHDIRRWIAGAACVMALAIHPTLYASEPIEADKIEAADSDAPSLKIISSGIEITNPSDKDVKVAIYALTGQLVKQADIPHGTHDLTLSPGYYIVKYSSLTRRVAIQ